MPALIADQPGAVEFLLANEAIARGAIEAGISLAAAYPGTPSSEIIGSLAGVARAARIHVEWSVNEKVAAEVAAAASFSGLRALTAMKHEGMNVAMDFLAHLNLVESKGGLVVVVADDPQGGMSENDSRPQIAWLSVPLMEPATAQEAKDMTRWAFDLSEELRLFCVIRPCTRVAHATGAVVLGDIRPRPAKPHFDTSHIYLPMPAAPKHAALLAKVERARTRLEESPFNSYEGPQRPDLLIVAAGAPRIFAGEVVQSLGLSQSVGILHLGTTWPLPYATVERHLAGVSRILTLEDVDPFIETNLKMAAAERGWLDGTRSILGKETGHVPRCGELSPDDVKRSLARLFNLEAESEDEQYVALAEDVTSNLTVERQPIWCPGCPHRGSFWAIKTALRLDGRDGFVAGDIGCYGMDFLRGGFHVVKTLVSMGSGTGVASGLGQLHQFGFAQPVVAVCGDSTFFHTALPALVNAKYNRATFTLVIVDNSATAMTGFQPHAGVGVNAMRETAPVVDIAAICRALDLEVQIVDPYDVETTTEKILSSIQSEAMGVRVFLSRRQCALLAARTTQPLYRVTVDQDRCIGPSCGCGAFCVRFFKCPALTWDRDREKARIDEALCTGCGICASVCSSSAIIKEAHGA